MNGVTEVYTVAATADGDKIRSTFTKYGDLRNGASPNASSSSSSSFAISLAVNRTNNKNVLWDILMEMYSSMTFKI